MTGDVIFPHRPSLKSWLLLAAIITTAVLVVWMSPAERSLGQGIKLVYIHVSLIWAAMVGFVIAGVLGAITAFSANPRLHVWQESMSWVALAWYVIGVLMAMLAAKINWGAVHWNEPLLLASLRFLAAAVLVQAAKNWIATPRVRGALNALLAFFLMFSILGAPQVMHPQSPIRQSTSATIQLTFLGMFILSSLAEAWAIWQVRKFFTTEKHGHNFQNP